MKKYVLILILFTLISSCEKQELEEIKLKNIEKVDSTFFNKLNTSTKRKVKSKKKRKRKILERWQSGRMRQS